MKRSSLLTLMFALCSSIQCWADFNPTAEKMYALKEKNTGLYLDIQTLGINEPNANATTNNISLNQNPCVIFFEKGNSAGTWKLKNIDNNYVGVGTRGWNAVIGAVHNWIVEETDGFVKLAKSSGNYISMDNPAAAQPLYNNKAEGLQFSLIEYTTSNLSQGYYSLKSPTGTYFNFTKHTNGTEATFQPSPTYFSILPSINVLMFEDKDNAGKFISTEGSNWNVTTTSATLWDVTTPDENGYVKIHRYADASNELGSNTNSDSGTGIFTNVPGNANKWLIEGVFDYLTQGTVVNGNYEFKSGAIRYLNACNKLRFTLTESEAFYKNGSKRMSLDEFVLYNAEGKKVELTTKNITGNNGKTYEGMFDGVNDKYAGTATWSDGTEDDYFEIILPKEVDLGGAFSFSFVTENTTMNAKAFRIETSYQKVNSIVYNFTVNAPENKEVIVTYNGQQIYEGQTFEEDNFDVALFAASEIHGYTWKVVVDEEHETISIVYTAVQVVENPEAVVALANRIGGAGTADKFKFVYDPSMNSLQEVFLLGNEDDKILIKGTTISAITTGLGWYLNNVAKINIAWNALNEKTVEVAKTGAPYAELTNLPIPTTTELHVSDAKYRYYLNYCTFGYSMTSWTWARWQQEIDWMALHGINMPLQIVGLEEVWRKFLTMPKYKYTAEQAKAFVAGPAYTAWWGMNNLEGWGGTAVGAKSGYSNLAGAGGVQDDAWYTRQATLAKKIVTLQRELGMQPVLPGWSGMVPSNFEKISGFKTRGNGGKWAGDFVRPLLLSVNNVNYAEIAADYYSCLKEVMGESQYYSMDPFHEGGGAGTMEDYKALYEAMEKANPGSQWVIQQWQWSATQKYSLVAVPEGRLIVLDLFSDGSPAFDSYNGYAPQEAIFCAIPNFGGRSGLMGRLQNVTDNYFKFKNKYASIKGIGTAPEAIEQTPITYDLIYQLPWMNGQKPSVEEWVQNYAEARYGQDNAVIKEAWNLLRQGPLNYGADGIQGPVEDVWAARPNLKANKASSWGKTLADAGHIYTKQRRQMLIDAVFKLLSQSEAINTNELYQSNYNYDLVEFGGAVMADYAYDLLLGIDAAKTQAGVNFTTDATYQKRRDAFLQLILDMDKFRGTNLNFRLGKWTQEARDAAREVVGATTATPDWYEYNNARTILTTWSSPGTNLTDYSYRSWQGLLKDYYYPRWKHYFDNNCTGAEYKFFEWNWAHGMIHRVGDTSISTTPLTEEQTGHTNSYTREPVGNTIEEATKILSKYILPITSNGVTYYAYRYLTNDLSNILTIPVQAGMTVDLTSYIGEVSDIATFESEAVEDKVDDISKVRIKDGVADGAHKATIKLADGTILTFCFSVNPTFSGTYYINYKNGDHEVPVFVGYNEDLDNAKNVGFKLMAQGHYSPTAEADKIFTVTPTNVGFKLCVQGKYLKAPNFSGWNHLMFSDNVTEAGIYLFEEVSTNVFKMLGLSDADNIKYVNDYDNLIFGNDKADKENLATFVITPAHTFPLSVNAEGMKPLCLPFHVTMADGMYAYDLPLSGFAVSDELGYECTMKVIAGPGQTLKSGTPAIICAKEGHYNLYIVNSVADAQSSPDGSLLKGNFVKQELTSNHHNVKFIFANKGDTVGFYRMNDAGHTMDANQCWLELDASILGDSVQAIRLRLDNNTSITEASSSTHEYSIYNLQGLKLKKPQPGLNIIDGKKVFIR